MASGLNFLAGPKEEPRPPVFDEKWRRARAAWRRVREEFGRATGASLHYERVLGMGGYGMAQLWTVRNADGDYVRDIVVKVPMPSPSRSNVADSIRREISWMGKTLRNAEHAVQLVYLTDIAKTDDYRIYNNPYVETPYLIMEALSRGTLMDLITSITQARYWNMANKGAGDQRKVGICPS
ncbi:hypothetical protein F4820DRAFT_132017 [Hypoxylon rubiginosum]|uniref:Uncharacterized protein n=1 Tax=Hypoxylon rubiginosum TaxID=110542 RepID=A0ACB9YL52_9PEZI|nr:hypothetical protein F4820DRAFT_132017 [Hypoxylon rubiginosum]